MDAESEDNLDTWQPESMAGVPVQPATQQPSTQHPHETQLPQTQQHFSASPAYDAVRAALLSVYQKDQGCHEGHKANVRLSRQLQSSLSLPVFMQLTQQWQTSFMHNEDSAHVPQQQAPYGRSIPVGGGA